MAILKKKRDRKQDKVSKNRDWLSYIHLDIRILCSQERCFMTTFSHEKVFHILG